MIKCPSGQIWCRGNLKVCDWFFTSFVLKSVEIKYGEGCTDRMQMHYHNYKLLIFRCLYRTIVIIDLLCGSKTTKTFREMWIEVWMFEMLTYEIRASYTRSTGVQFTRFVWKHHNSMPYFASSCCYHIANYLFWEVDGQRCRRTP